LLWLQNCCNCYMQVYKRKSLLQVFQIVTSFGNEFLWRGNFVLTLLEYRRISDRVLLLLLGGLGLPVLISLLSILIEKKPLNFKLWTECHLDMDASVLRAQIALRLGREEYHNPHGEAPISHWTRAFSAEEQWFQVGLFEENAMNLEVDQPAYRYFINSQSTGPCKQMYLEALQCFKWYVWKTPRDLPLTCMAWD